MRIFYLIALLLLSFSANSAVVRLTDCGVLPGSISESGPFDLDVCNLENGDDIALLIDDVVAEWGDVYLRAPSSTVNVIYTGTQTFTGIDFYFVEDGARANKLTITHVPDDYDARMWEFVNLTGLKIGGSKLTMSFVGTHPGLGQGKPCTGTREACSASTVDGLIRISLTDSSNPELADIRANFKNTWAQGIHFLGAQSQPSQTNNKWQQVNIAGVFNASGVNVNSGVQNIWIDPDRTIVMDPFSRTWGWDGGVAGISDGNSYGCIDDAREQPRNSPAMYLNFTSSITGGVTLQYGLPNANAFIPYKVGVSVDSPYIVRYRDYGRTGPTEITGLAEGVLTKLGGQARIMKNDPAPAFDFTGPTGRFLRFVELPGKWGNGVLMGGIASGCEPGNSTDNSSSTGSTYIWIAEASRDGVSSQYVNAYWDVTFQGIEPWVSMQNTRTYINASGAGPDNSPGPSTPDRSYGHVIRAAGNTVVPGITTGVDTVTITGPGGFYEVSFARIPIDQGGYIYPNDNTLSNVSIYSLFNIGDDATNTTVSNVDFTNASTVFMTVGTGSDVTMTDICVNTGQQITGTGTVTIDGGSALTLPYTFLSSLNNCSIISQNPPNAPGV